MRVPTAILTLAVAVTAAAHPQASDARSASGAHARAAHEAGRFEEAFALATTAMETACPQPEAATSECLEAISLVARYAIDVDRAVQGEPLARRALTGWLARGGRDTPGGARAMIALAGSLETRDAAGAAALYRRAVQLLDTPDTPIDQAAAQNGLARLAFAAGEFATAERQSRMAVDQLTVAAPNSLALARAQGDLGRALSAQRAFGPARISLQAALGWFETQLGAHPLTADSAASLAYVLSETGQLRAAEARYRQAHAIDVAIGGETGARAIDSLNGLAAALVAAGRPAEAEPMFRKALAARLARYGDRHAATAESYNNLASTLGAMGRHAEAEPIYRHALDLRVDLFGLESAQSAISHGNLGGNLRNQRRYALAAPLLRRALAIDRAVHGDRHPSTALAHSQLARVLEDQQLFEEAEANHNAAILIYRALAQPDEIGLATSLNNLGYNLHQQRRDAAAIAPLREALTRYRAIFGDRHPLVAKPYKNLGLALQATGDIAGAESMYRSALAIQASTLGATHPDLLEGRRNYGLLALRRLDRPGVALAQFRLATQAVMDRTRDAGRDASADDELRHYRGLFAYRVESAWRLAAAH